MPYEAGGAYATLEGTGTVAVELDGGPAQVVDVRRPALYPLAEHPRHEGHTMALHPSPGLRIWSLSFAAGIP